MLRAHRHRVRQFNIAVTTLSVLLPPIRSVGAQDPNSSDGARAPVLSARARDRFTSIAAVRELTDGSLLVSDPEGGTLWRVARDGTRRPISGLGVPGTLVAASDNSTLVFDRQGTRFMQVQADGTVTDAPASLAPPAGPMRIGMNSDLYVADATGRLYWLDGARDASGARIQRRDVGGATTTLATLRNQPMRQVREGAIGYTMLVPFTPVDDWAVAPDGSLVVVRGEPFRVERGQGSGVVQGSIRMLPAVAVSNADREAHQKQQRQSLASINISGLNSSLTLPDDAYPATMAPFARDATRLGPDGSVWVHRIMSAAAKRQLIELFGADAEWRETIGLPSKARIVGFGANQVYVAVPQGERDYSLVSFAR